MQEVLTGKASRVVILGLAVAALAVHAVQAKSTPRPVYGIGDNMSVYSDAAAKAKPVYGIGDNMSVYSSAPQG
jgi:hypothetical protein